MLGRWALPAAITVFAFAFSCRTEGEMVENGANRVPEVAISVAPAGGETGDAVDIVGSGFPSGMEVVVGFGPPHSEYDILDRGRADEQGNFGASVSVPDWAEPGREYVWVVAGPRNQPHAVSDPFMIRGPDPPASEQVTILGVMTDEGVECPAMRDEDGRLYTLAGAPEWATPGTHVVVRGSVAEMSFCQQGTTIAVFAVDRR